MDSTNGLIAKLEALDEKATTAPWGYSWNNDEIELFDQGVGENGEYPACEELYVYCSNSTLKIKQEDLALIVELRNNLPLHQL